MTAQASPVLDHPVVDRAPPPPLSTGSDGVFPSPDVRAEMLALYDAKLAEWPVPFEEIDVPARFGTTHVVVAGDPAAPPLLLVHMTSCPAFVWAPIVAPLATRRRLYAVDTIGDVGKSELADPTRFPRTGAEYAAWLDGVLDALGVSSADVIAGSHGGWIGMHYAGHSPARVRRLVLLVPMGLASWTRMLSVIGRMATFALGGMSDARMERTLSWLMGDTPAARQLMGDWIARVIREHFPVKLGAPMPVPAAVRKAIRAPTLVVLGGHDRLVGDAASASRRATATIAAVDVEVVPNGTHAVHIEESERVVARIVEFLERGDRTVAVPDVPTPRSGSVD